MNILNLSGKNIIVTGASSGLGRTTSIVLSQLGANVCLIGRDLTRLKETANQMIGDKNLIIPFDLCKFDEYKNMFDQIKSHFGLLHGLIHFAGINKMLPLKIMKISQIKEIVEINLYSFLELTKFFTQKTIVSPDGASIIAVSSTASLKGVPAFTSYSASKAAINGAVRCLACELASKKIRVNSIAPGYIETEMNLKLKASLSQENYEQIVKSHPLGIGKPEDVAYLAAFLLNDAARWITGITIPIDGGFTIHS